MTPRSDRYAFVCGHTGGIVVGEQSRCRAVDEVYRDPKLTFGNPAHDRDNSLTGQDFRQYKSLVARHRANNSTTRGFLTHVTNWTCIGHLNRHGMSGGSTSWQGWSHVRWFVEEVPAGAA